MPPPSRRARGAEIERLIRRGPDRLDHGPCTEGVRSGRGLLADCWYRLGRIRQKQGRRVAALRAYRRHLQLRARSATIYESADVKGRIAKLLER